MHKTILQYINGWKEGNKDKILSSLSNDCVIIESHGPMYKGRDKVKKWTEEWLSKGKIVSWNITSEYIFGNTIIFEWIFQYIFDKKESKIEGITVAKLKDDKISYLREYKTTKPVFEFE